MDGDTPNVATSILASSWASAIAWYGWVWAAMLFIRQVSKTVDDELNPTKRQHIAQLLTRSQLKSGADQWLPDFKLVFDRFFGANPYSFGCFFRSALISMTSFFALYWLLGGNRDFVDHLTTVDLSTIDYWALTIGVAQLVILAFAANAVVDYLSLIQTRMLLDADFSLSLKILLDALLTFSLSFLWMSFLFSSGPDNHGYLDSMGETWRSLSCARGDELNCDTEILPWAAKAVLLTSFTTSVWLWLHGLAQLAIRLSNQSLRFFSWLNVEEKPIRSIGVAVNFLLFSVATLVSIPLILLA